MMMTHHHHKQQHPVIMAVVIAVVCSFLLQLPLPASSSTAAAGGGTYANNNHTAMTSIAPPPCLPGQAAALLRLKRSFAATDASTAAFASWKAGTDCCRWHGVRCDGGGGGGHHGNGNSSSRGSVITSLDLSERGLRSAALDPAIFSLTSLRYLNLAGNDFGASELPSAWFERLADLTHLNLSMSNLSGIVPEAIGHLVNLVSLDLSVPVSFSSDIVFADDDDAVSSDDENETTFQPLVLPNFGSFISELKNLRELRLDLAAISMSESDSDQGTEAAEGWCNALAIYTPNLRVLTLPFSLPQPDEPADQPTSICGSFSRLTSLAILDLRANGLSGPVPDFFANFSSLRVLQLSYNNLEGTFPSAILQKTMLEMVDLSGNIGITGSLPRFPVGSKLKHLLLRDTSFSGEIPSSIGNLRSLEELDLAQQAGLDFSEIFSAYGPGFSGTLPSSIGNLGSLELLSLSGFGLVGSISPWIGNLTSLTILELSNCGLSGPIPSSLAELKKLEEVTLSNCNFSGTVQLSWFFRLPNLSILSLSNNNLFVVDGEDNSSLVYQYPRIKSLGLASCGIEEFPKLLRHRIGPNDTNTNWLDISQNRIRGPVPQWAWENWSGSHLQYLNLSHNSFTGFSGLSQAFLPFSVDRLDLSSNMFEGPIPLPQNPNKGGAWELDYSSNMFSSIPLNFSIRASIFRASRNNLSGSSILASFCDAINLQVLDLSYNNLSGPIPSCLMEVASNELHVLNLKKNRLHGQLPHNINGSCSLEVLDIGDNEIKGKLPRSLAACSNLTILDIQNNLVSDCFPCWMSTLIDLTVLVLSSNEFFGKVGPSTAEDKNICKFPNIKILDLASNNFSGTLTEEWLATLTAMMGKEISSPEEAPITIVVGSDSDKLHELYQITIELTYKGSDLTIQTVLWILTFLDVSNNHLQGSIPALIGEFMSLNMLNMSHNSLTGPIPSELGNLRQLEALDLSSNELSGEIPPELTSLDFLATLNLSDNKLVGSIPESPHFLTFSNSSFLGNDGLCGPPLSKGCINKTTTQSVAQHRHSKKDSVDIMLFLFSGIGFGVGFAITIVLAWGIPVVRRRS